eukprot:886625-Rhodomonas_salina.1
MVLSRTTAVSVGERRLEEAERLLRSSEGLLCCPDSASRHCSFFSADAQSLISKAAIHIVIIIILTDATLRGPAESRGQSAGAEAVPATAGLRFSPGIPQHPD